MLEFRGVPDPRRPEHHFDSRWRRFASRLARGSIGASWRVVTADRAINGDYGLAIAYSAALIVLMMSSIFGSGIASSLRN